MKQQELKKTAKELASKTTKAAKKSAKHLQENPKTALYLGVSILAVALVYQGVKAISNVGDGIADAFIGDPNAGGGNVDDLIINQQPTISETQAQIFASEIISAVDSWGTANEEEYQTIQNVLAGKNAKDYQLISNAFGTPRRNPITGEEAFPLMGSQLNLSQWLSIELSTEQKTRLYNVAPLIFSN